MPIELSERLGDLQSCNNEQIHLSGAVQGYGSLILYTPEDMRIQGLSENLQQVLGLAEKDVIGQRLDYVFDISLVSEIRRVQEAYPWRSAGVSLEHVINDQLYDIYMFNTDGVFGLEFEPMASGMGEAFTSVESLFQDFVGEAKAARDARDLSQIACRYIRKITGIDRVMMYRFMPPTMHGEVIGEDRVMGSHSFMDHRFPSSDIPKPARDLYLRNKVRMIASSSGGIAAIRPSQNPKTGKAWNLSDSRLRSVSPIHLDYLVNMKVNGSMSFAVVSQNELWGLIACHHVTPFRMSHRKRAICSAIADIVSSQATLMESLDTHMLRSTFESRLKSVIELALSSKDPLKELLRQHKILMESFNVTGAAIVSATSHDIAGLVPPASMLKNLYAKIMEEMRTQDKKIIFTQDMREMMPDWTAKNIACGLLAVKVQDRVDSLFLLFRPELVKMIIWGGDPVKNLEKKNFKGDINPRASFETWQETVENRSAPWASFEVDGIFFLKEVVFDSALAKKQALDELSLRVTRK